jgi:glycosyltransferase involved in cell wall biosynthesis
MRILLVANTLPPEDISGVGEQVLQLAAGLEGLGHQVRVLGRAGRRARKLLFPLTVVPAFARTLLEFRPHVVQVHESDGALALLAAVVVRPLLDPRPHLSASLQVSYVEELRAVRPIRFEGRVLGRPSRRELVFKVVKAPLQILLGWLTADLADTVNSPSRTTAAEVRRDYRLAEVGVFPNVMGGRHVSVGPAAPVGAAAGYLLYVGRLRIRKAVEVLLEALALLGDGRPEVLVVGDGEHAGRLARRVAELGLAVEFLGRRDPGQVRSLMERAGGLVVPSIYEGMPLVVLEAMEAGLPVIASRVSGIPEVVIDGETGWLVPPEDPPALAAALDEWRRDPGEARRRGEAGRRRLETLYSTAGTAARWLDLVAPGPLEGGPSDGAQSDR